MSRRLDFFLSVRIVILLMAGVMVRPLPTPAQQDSEPGAGGRGRSCDCPPPAGFSFQCQGRSALRMVDSTAGHDCIPLPDPINALCPNGQVLQAFKSEDGSKTCVNLPATPAGHNFGCGVGRVLQEVNTITGNKKCVDMPPATPDRVSCPDGQVLTGLTTTGQPTCKEAAVELHSCHRVQQDNFDHCICPTGEVMTMHNADAVGPSEYHGFHRPISATAGRMFFQANCDCCKIRIKFQ